MQVNYGQGMSVAQHTGYPMEKGSTVLNACSRQVEDIARGLRVACVRAYMVEERPGDDIPAGMKPEEQDPLFGGRMVFIQLWLQRSGYEIPPGLQLVR